jgi:hypothetical protein
MKISELLESREVLADAVQLYEAIRYNTEVARTASISFRHKGENIIVTSQLQNELMVVCAAYLSSRIDGLKDYFEQRQIDPELG